MSEATRKKNLVRLIVILTIFVVIGAIISWLLSLILGGFIAALGPVLDKIWEKFSDRAVDGKRDRDAKDDLDRAIAAELVAKIEVDKAKAKVEAAEHAEGLEKHRKKAICNQAELERQIALRSQAQAKMRAENQEKLQAQQRADDAAAEAKRIREELAVAKKELADKRALELTAELARKTAEAKLINLDAIPFIPGGWQIESHQKGGHWEWDLKKVALFQSEGQKGGKGMKGYWLKKELEEQPVLNANVLDWLLTHPELIPEEWKGKKSIYFWGTTYHLNGVS